MNFENNQINESEREREIVAPSGVEWRRCSTESPNPKIISFFSYAVPPCLSRSPFSFFFFVISEILNILKIQKRGERERERESGWEKCGWDGFSYVYVYIFEFASFLVPPLKFQNNISFCLPFFSCYNIVYLIRHIFSFRWLRTLLIICSTQELIDCLLAYLELSILLDFEFSRMWELIANHIFVEKVTLVRFVRCLVERFVNFGTERRLSHDNNKSGGTRITRYMCMCMRMHLSLSFLLLYCIC